MGAARALSELARSFHGADVLVLCYHRVRRRERFADQMAALSAHGYSLLSMAQFRDWLNGKPLPSLPAALLTFDHCYAEQLENVVPVLDSLKFPATFFPASAGLTHEIPDVSAHWRNNLLALTKAGHTIGCHTHSHPDLTRLTVDEVRHEVVGSKQILEHALGQPVSAFCYPYGAYNARIASVVREAGFDVAFTVDLGGVRPGDDPYRLTRVAVLGEPSAGEFTAYLSGTRGVSGTILLYWKVRERLLERRGWWVPHNAHLA